MTASLPPVFLAYATTSGTTRMVAAVIAEALAPAPVVLADLKSFDPATMPRGLALAVLGTPTYGIGDCHSTWRERGTDVAAALPPGLPLALFCLGDARGHGGSFAGGLAALDSIFPSSHPRLAPTRADLHAYAFSPSACGGEFPGLVVQYRRHRAQATEQAREWAGALLRRVPQSAEGRLSSAA